MAKKIALMLGNGFTIDFLKHLTNRRIDSVENIDVDNLFRLGDSLIWPGDNRPGFLSHKNCPNLWAIGVRPYLSKSETLVILERVVTSANVYSLKHKDQIEGQGKTFLMAYKELVYYLKYLFTAYDNQITDEQLRGALNDWSWIEFIKRLAKDDNVEEVLIVTFNYDIWLERILRILDIDFDLPELRVGSGSKFKIFKPHGSISFLHSRELPKDSFSINYQTFFSHCDIAEVVVDYSNLQRHTAMNFIIPPAGDAGRNSWAWMEEVKKYYLGRIRNFTPDDILMLCGISYWHVDRSEVDAMLVAFNENTEVLNINPAPSHALDAVLNSLFINYKYMAGSGFLKDYPL